MKLSLALVAVLSFGFNVLGDEGMWLYNHLPAEKIEKAYGFKVTPEWTDHLMKSSLRIGAGGSGSFISADGLILTNHHVAANSLAKLSQPGGKDYYKESFLASKPAEELKTPDLEINQLVSIEDVTQKVNDAVKPEMSVAEANQARSAVISKLELADPNVKKQKKQVVTLYQGGRYHLYVYKVYDDIRLVFTPGFDIAFFGGDPDNFEFPRWCLDMTVLRAYENDKPAKIDHYLKWSEKGVKEGDLVFVSGHPGKTNRLLTVAAMEFLRDVRLPFADKMLNRLEIAYQQFGNQGTEEARRVKDSLFSIQNSRKAYAGKLLALQDGTFMAKKSREELRLRLKVLANPKLKPQAEAWDKIARAQVKAKKLYPLYSILESPNSTRPLEPGYALNSKLFRIARILVRLAEEDTKPNSARLREFQDAGRASLERDLFSEAPIYADLEEAQLADSLTFLVKELGFKNPLVSLIMQGKTAPERAAELVGGTDLLKVDVRKYIASQKKQGIDSSYDPMIRLAVLIDKQGRGLRKQYEEQIEEVERQAYAQIAAASFEVLQSESSSTTGSFESNVYPDATFTLRLSYGQVKGYKEGTKAIPALTQFAGAYSHESDHGSLDPFKLPSVWHDRKDKLDLSTPFNFVSTNDIIGGNSGSPAVNQNGELVGLIFDGNIQSLAGDYYYNDVQNRATSVHSAGMKEALEKLYDAQSLFSSPQK